MIFFGWHVCSKHWFQSALKQWNSCVSKGSGVWGFASAVRGKTDNGGHIISVIPMEIKKEGGHLFSTLTKKTNWQTKLHLTFETLEYEEHYEI